MPGGVKERRATVGLAPTQTAALARCSGAGGRGPWFLSCDALEAPPPPPNAPKPGPGFRRGFRGAARVFRAWALRCSPVHAPPWRQDVRRAQRAGAGGSQAPATRAVPAGTSKLRANGTGGRQKRRQVQEQRGRALARAQPGRAAGVGRIAHPLPNMGNELPTGFRTGGRRHPGGSWTAPRARWSQGLGDVPGPRGRWCWRCTEPGDAGPSVGVVGVEGTSLLHSQARLAAHPPQELGLEPRLQEAAPAGGCLRVRPLSYDRIGPCGRALSSRHPREASRPFHAVPCRGRAGGFSHPRGRTPGEAPAYGVIS